MRGTKRTSGKALHVLVLIFTVLATVVAFTNSASAAELLAEVTSGFVSGLLVAGIEVLEKMNRAKPAHHSMSFWWHLGSAVLRREVSAGVSGGYLLGLVVAMWTCWNG